LRRYPSPTVLAAFQAYIETCGVGSPGTIRPQYCDAVTNGGASSSTPFCHRTHATSVKMDAVVNILDVGERQKVMRPIGSVLLPKSNLAGFDAIDDTHMQAVITHDFHVLLDLLRRNHHGGLPVLPLKQTPTLLAEFRKVRAGGRLMSRVG